MDMMKRDLAIVRCKECPFAWGASFDREDGSWQYNNEGALRVRQRKPAGVTLRTARRLPSSGQACQRRQISREGSQDAHMGRRLNRRGCTCGWTMPSSGLWSIQSIA